MLALLLGVSESTTRVHDRAVLAAADELGYENGGLDTPIAAWPDTGRPWRPRLDPDALWHEVYHLRTACWIVIAYLSGMRDDEIRELHRDCAVAETTDDGRIRYKLRGRVFKHRKLSGDEAEWVVLWALSTRP
jgi:integrase